MYDTEGVEERDHSGSLEFYKENFNAMNDGCEVFNPQRFSIRDGHISAI